MPGPRAAPALTLGRRMALTQSWKQGGSRGDGAAISMHTGKAPIWFSASPAFFPIGPRDEDKVRGSTATKWAKAPSCPATWAFTGLARGGGPGSAALLAATVQCRVEHHQGDSGQVRGQKRAGEDVLRGVLGNLWHTEKAVTHSQAQPLGPRGRPRPASSEQASDAASSEVAGHTAKAEEPRNTGPPQLGQSTRIGA